jgi:hypothetical protein
VCYSVAISTVFQACLTAYLIEPGYEEPIRDIDQMLKSEKKFGFSEGYENIYTDSDEYVDIAILKNGVHCRDWGTCLEWENVYHNFSTITDELDMHLYRGMINWTDENNRRLLCELEDGYITAFDMCLVICRENALLEYINDVIGHIAEGVIFM